MEPQDAMGREGIPTVWPSTLLALKEDDPHAAHDPICHRVIDMRLAESTIATPLNATELRTIYFCSSQCRAFFEEDPLRYGFNR